jgi:hypothetical protein
MRTALLITLLAANGFCAEKPYGIVGTGQTKCYDDRHEIAPPTPGQPFHAQDAQHPGSRFSKPSRRCAAGALPCLEKSHDWW